MIRRTPLQRTRQIKRGKQLVKSNRKRRAKNWARAYGSEERVAFVKSLPCVAREFGGFELLHRGTIHNHHIVTGGTSRKADANQIVPVCAHHHGVLHSIGRESFERAYGIDLEQEAAKCEAAWQATQTVKGDL